MFILRHQNITKNTYRAKKYPHEGPSETNKAKSFRLVR